MHQKSRLYILELEWGIKPDSRRDFYLNIRVDGRTLLPVSHALPMHARFSSTWPITGYDNNGGNSASNGNNPILWLHFRRIASELLQRANSRRQLPQPMPQPQPQQLQRRRRWRRLPDSKLASCNGVKKCLLIA